MTGVRGLGYFIVRAERSRKHHFSRYLALRLAVVLVLVLDTLRRMFSGTRPVDYVMLVIEFLVLFIILWEAVAHAVHRSRIRRRTKVLGPLLTAGQELQRKGPSAIRQGGDSGIKAWMAEVGRWVTDTEGLLSDYSSDAYASFTHDEEGFGLK